MPRKDLIKVYLQCIQIRLSIMNMLECAQLLKSKVLVERRCLAVAFVAMSVAIALAAWSRAPSQSFSPQPIVAMDNTEALHVSVRAIIPASALPGDFMTIAVPGHQNTFEVQVPDNARPGQEVSFIVARGENWRPSVQEASHAAPQEDALSSPVATADITDKV
jgi:hypothetical protein